MITTVQDDIEDDTTVPEAKDGQKQPSKSLIKKFAPLAVIIGGLGAAYAAGVQDYFSLNYLAESRAMLTGFVAEQPILSGMAFTAIYATAVAFSFPAASILTVFAGFLFGWLAGGLMVAVGATVGATAIFLAAKSTLGAFLREKMPKRVKAMAEGFEKDAFSYLLVLRIAPVFPFFVTNIAPALFKVKVRDYVIATFLGILPGTFAYAYLGEGVGSVIDAAEASGSEPSIADLVTTEITLAFVGLAVVAAIPVIVRKLKGAK